MPPLIHNITIAPPPSSHHSQHQKTAVPDFLGLDDSANVHLHLLDLSSWCASITAIKSILELLVMSRAVLRLIDHSEKIVQFIMQTIDLLREPFKLYDTTDFWKPLLGAKENFLEIFDIPFSTEKPAKLLLKDNNIDKVDGAVNSLPEQEEHTIRVYLRRILAHQL